MSLTESILNRIESFIKEALLINPGDYVLISLSGGSDSTALTLILNDLKSSLNINKIGIAHYNHKLRGDESERDEKFCKNLAQKLGVEFYRGELDEEIPSGVSKQVFFRQKRYDFLNKTAEENSYDKIATGHTLDDIVENILMRLFTGTGVSGLTGIASKMNNIIRPVVFLTRQELENLLKNKNQEFVVDSSNNENKYMRNSVRNNIIPAVQEIFPNYREAIFRFTEIAKLENDYFDNEIKKLYNEIVIREKNQIKIPGDYGRKIHPALFSRLVLYIAGEMNLNLSFINVKDIYISCNEWEQGTSEVLLMDNVKILNEYGDIIFLDIQQTTPEELPVVELEQGKKIEWGDFSFELKKMPIIDFEEPEPGYHVYFDADKIEDPLSVRSPIPGDRIKLFRQGNGKKLKELFINNKIPVRLKKRVAVIQDKNEIIAVIAPPDSNRKIKRTSLNTYVDSDTSDIILVKIYANR